MDSRKSAAAAPVIETHALTRVFGSYTAVDRLNLAVPRGAIYGFIGSNGSGKSTAIRMICGLLPPTSGTAYVLGCDTAAHPERARQSLGYMSQRFSLYANMTVAENMMFYGGLYGLTRDERRTRTQEVLVRMQLTDKRDVLAGGLSGGQKQRLALGCAILHRPALLVLDEPTSAVDPTSRRLFWNLLSEMAGTEQTTIFVTTHFMDEAEHCDEIAFLQRGRKIASGSPTRLKEELPARLYVLPEEAAEAGEAALRAAGVAFDEVYVFGRQVRALVPRDAVLPEELHAAPWELTMEDVFIYYDRRQRG
ncbi:ABC transporter ATP-binding protein [Selenomonas timonae]|uniref:ABC transporter ATP-binding protein n=1 Tax=Selenomonas timonae TaxID=2754044 RepID=A0A7G7VLC8_9FIRM|nr:ABC transporter ATP-binding protein [Selenomonas timonae]QNH54921.1 ABC transporter ATP-binding protein [Selenomonas timonae]